MLSPHARRSHSSSRSRTTLTGTFLVLAAGTAAWTGCTEKIDLTGPVPGNPNFVLATPDSVQEIFTAHCTFSGCHDIGSAAAGQNLSSAQVSYANIVNVPSTDIPSLFRVEPGDTTDSYVVRKLRNRDIAPGTAPMPLGSFPLADSLVQRIVNWVHGGAPGETIFVAPIAAGTR